MSKKINNIQLRSEEVQEILTRVPHWMIRYGNTVFLSLILMVLLLSWFIKYPDLITSEALITTSIPPQKEYAKTFGRISRLLVENNQDVPANTPLAILENAADYKDVFFLKSILDTIKTDTETFEFPMDSLPILYLGDLETDFALFQNNYYQYKLNKELQPFANEALANKFTETELQARLSLLENQKDINKNELLFKEREVARHKTLFEKGVISSQEYENKQLEYFQAERNYKNISVSISQLRESISSAKRNSKGNQITKKTEELKQLKAVLQSFNQLKKSIRDWELQYAFISHIDGKVSFLNAWSENQNIEAGDLLFTIIPAENSRYIAKLKAPIQNSGKIKRGQKVNIRLENFPDEEFGMLTGVVRNISLLPDKEGFFSVDVELPEKLITNYNKEIVFTQEMKGAGEIVTEDLRLMERFFYQLRNIFKR
ncbi:MAG: HlyD family secretion protein [Flavobacteriales bacterium CG_4_9_14_3_um_filter_40_17]|nr:MAG: HlyD family secretion protein [Flavobacteriales bacterium CG_4_9_14_3_um_filter_40_17]